MQLLLDDKFVFCRGSGSFVVQERGSLALTNIALALSSFSQVGTFVAMLHYVEQITQSEREALELMPYDLEVLELDPERSPYKSISPDRARIFTYESNAVGNRDPAVARRRL